MAVYITAAMVLSSTMTPVYAESDDSFINFTEDGAEIVEGNTGTNDGTEVIHESDGVSTEQDDVIWFSDEAKDTGVGTSSAYKESIQRQDDETGLKEKFTKVMTLDSMPGDMGENVSLSVHVNKDIEDGTVMVDEWSGYNGSVLVSVDGSTSEYTPGSVINFEKGTETIDFLFADNVSLSSIPSATVTGTVDKGTEFLCDYMIDYSILEESVDEDAEVEEITEDDVSNDQKEDVISEADQDEEKEEAEDKDTDKKEAGDTELSDGGNGTGTTENEDSPDGSDTPGGTDIPGDETPSTPDTPSTPSTPEEPDTPADPGKLVLPTITADKTTIYVNGDSTDNTQQKDTMSKVSVDGFEYPAVPEDKRTETVIDKPAYDEPIMRDVYVCTICGEKFETPEEASEHCSTAHQDDQTISPSYEKEEEISGYKHHDAETHEEGAKVKVIIEVEVDSSLSPVLWQEPDFENADMDIKIKESSNTSENVETETDTESTPSIATITLTYKDVTKPIKQTKPLVVNTVGNIPEQSTENDIVKTASVKGTISSSIEESPYTIAPVSISVIKEKADDGTTVDPGVDPGTGGDDIPGGEDSGEGTVTPVPVNPTPVEPEPTPVEEEVQEEEKEPTVVEEIVDNVLNFVSENSDVVSTTSMATTATRSGATATKELIDRARRNTTETSQIEDVVEDEKTDEDVTDRHEESHNGGSLEDEIKTQTEESEKGETVVQPEGDDNSRLPSDTKRFVEGGIIIGLVLALGGIASYIVFLKKNDDDDDDDDNDGNSENSDTPPVAD